MWAQQAPVVLFEDEDEAALKTRFIELCARHPHEDAFAVAAYVFKDLREPELRSKQAALLWSRDIEVRERIRLARLNGGKEAAPATSSKEQRLAKLEALADDPSTPHKERIAAYKLIAEMQGEIVKAVDVTSDKKPLPAFPQPVYVEYDDIVRGLERKNG